MKGSIGFRVSHLVETVFNIIEMNTENGNIFRVARCEDIFHISLTCIQLKPERKKNYIKRNDRCCEVQA